MNDVRRLGSLARAAAAAIWVLLVLGGAVCFLGAAKAIPDWPTSFGGFAPPAEAGALVEYLHRAVAMISGVLVLACAIVGVRRFRSSALLSAAPLLAIVLLALVAVLGAIVVLRSLPPALAAVDLGSALVVFALMLTVSAAARRLGAGARGPIRLAFRDAPSRLSLGAASALFLALATGLSVGVPAPANCLGLPLWGSRAGLALAQLIVASLAGILIVAMAVHAWTRRRTETVPLWLATVAVVLYFALILTGELAAARGFPPALMAVRVSTAATLWAVVAGLAAWEGLRGAGPASAHASGPASRSRGARRVKDLASMTRPAVTGLLLATAYAGMLCARGGVPAAGVTVATLAALALAAGGAQALNQYLDRDMDALMARTARRPLPTGRLSPAEGAAWGTALIIASIYLMGELVGALAAALTALGVAWYLALYTAALKRRSPFSIVAGGVSGALMPLVGSVAVTGGVAGNALMLSVIVFLWTPPHFWSLAVVRAQEYARAGVPALPAVRGEVSARRQVLVYAVALVAATVGLPLVGAAGSLFLASAVALGAALLVLAGRLWRRGGDRAASVMYRFSSFYLAVLLAALAVDTLL